jgi:hypothetical protein
MDDLFGGLIAIIVEVLLELLPEIFGEVLVSLPGKADPRIDRGVYRT